MSPRDERNTFVAFWLVYVVVIALCVCVVALRGQARMIAFAAWFLAAGVDGILLYRGVKR